ncbi:uncharacterized protein TRIADDRAFT_29631 [Trichoplax adhaerens]|uniref:G-protein coupled receptors family 3 profile domain-containing protein n=1 Tax=Trichoplax adhaerens TaxID=10228 RepID=B3S5Z7_TRIAD|nr:hypothetical protein TRIADDRAFT_29631 [Trichoplax adhaerens]EDV22003.1 hypothetical protein TRIADDRAFT_29631 [Trichoplax adhaerens]|eukprot:XP_002115640.1 hypothetical protein TRIADDRAFT_29631 [Trichoplax adhaerens]
MSNHSYIIGVIGDESDDVTVATAAYTGSLRVCQISYFSFDYTLSLRRYFPFFYRTSPPASFQATAIMELLTRFNWNLVSFVFAGNTAIDLISKFIYFAGPSYNICYSYLGKINDNYTKSELVDVVLNLKNQSSRVIVLIGVERVVYSFFKVAEALNLTGMTFVGSYTWLTSSLMYNIRADVIGGSIGFKFKGRSLDRYHSYLKNLNLCNNGDNPWFMDVLKTQLSKAGYNISTVLKECTIEQLQLSFLNSIHSPSYISIFVMDAVLALANAFHNAIGCNSTSCPPLNDIDLNKLRLNDFLNRIQFPGVSSNNFQFDFEGSPIMKLDIVNLQRETNYENRTVRPVMIGYWDREAGVVINESLIDWDNNSVGNNAPNSRCSSPCLPGTYWYHDNSIDKRYRPCCWKCKVCPKQSITNTTNQYSCIQCSNETKSNANRTACIPLKVVTIRWDDTISIVFYIVASLYLIVLLWIWSVMIRKRDTPVVKGSNFTLVNILLFFISLCVPAGGLFLRPPSMIVCHARVILVTLMDIGILATILCKTNQISVIFQNAINQDSKTAPLRKTSVQILFIFLIVFINIGIVVCLMLIYPIKVTKNVRIEGYLTIICFEESSYPSIYQLVSSGILGLLCVYLAFKARSLPDNFNESRYIYLSSILLLALEFISSPALFLLYGMVRDYLLSLFMLTFGLSPLLCFFIPKIYVIYFRPDLNTKAGIKSSITQFTFSNLSGHTKCGQSYKSSDSSATITSS